MDKLVVLSDLQVSYVDYRTLAGVHDFLIDFQPDTFVLNGDIVDMSALSRFRLTLTQRSGLGREREELRALLRTWRNLMPRAHMVYIMGNHEQRLADYITDNAPELAFLGNDELSFSGFADLARVEAELIAPYGEYFDWYGLMITHGEVIRENTARANLSKEGSSGISSHTHRLSSYYKTDRSGAHAWYETGCLCNIVGPDVPPPTKPGIRNWQQGFVYGYAAGDRAWNIYQVSINDHKFVAEGKQYGG